MADFRTGQIVFSKRGRDKGLPFIVLKVDGEYLYLADGKLRTLSKPKKKKAKHVQPTNAVCADIAAAADKGVLLLDSDIRKAVDSYGK